MTHLAQLSFTFESLSAGYRQGLFTPVDVVHEVYRRLQLAGDNPIWISIAPFEVALAQAAALSARAQNLPLYGLPFAVKDNIDVSGLATTAACAALAYQPEQHAFVVDVLIEAGAIVIGKTNLDQFATGLTGTRSPYGVCRNALDPRYISGGSSSGSAVAVALGQVSFSLGTDTAGSGRVPAALNNIVGLKPSRGLLSGRGVQPASASIDCVSIFALSVTDAQRVLQVSDVEDKTDDYARQDRTQCSAPSAGFKVGVPRADQIAGLGESGFDVGFAQAQLSIQVLGGELVEIDIAPLLDCGAMLYGSAILAERYHALHAAFATAPDAMHPVVREVVAPGATFSGPEVYAAQQRVQHLKQLAATLWHAVDVILLPTVDSTFSIEQVLADPVQLNARLGRYTNFVNLLDMSALALPSGFVKSGLPFGITLIAPALHDAWLGQLGTRYQENLGGRLGATSDALSQNAPCVSVAVVGAHLSGQPLNYQLVERGARLLKQCRSAPGYRLYALANTTPPKPGLVKDDGVVGEGIALEVWSMPLREFGSFVALIPSPLGIGTLTLDDGELVKGFVCEPYALAGARDITAFGGWLAYLESLRQAV